MNLAFADEDDVSTVIATVDTAGPETVITVGPVVMTTVPVVGTVGPVVVTPSPTAGVIVGPVVATTGLASVTAEVDTTESVLVPAEAVFDIAWAVVADGVVTKVIVAAVGGTVAVVTTELAVAHREVVGVVVVGVVVVATWLAVVPDPVGVGCIDVIVVLLEAKSGTDAAGP